MQVKKIYYHNRNSTVRTDVNMARICIDRNGNFLFTVNGFYLRTISSAMERDAEFSFYGIGWELYHSIESDPSTNQAQIYIFFTLARQWSLSIDSYTKGVILVDWNDETILKIPIPKIFKRGS
jgi:hypothetical protein